MNQSIHGRIVAHIRRLAADGVVLYIRIKAEDVTQLRLNHGMHVVLDVGGKCVVRVIVKTTNDNPWLAPDVDGSNAEITETLRKAGLDHGDDIEATIFEHR